MKYFILFLNLSITFLCHSQVLIEGTVKDTLGNPLPLVSVVLKSTISNQILEYDYTNESGEYSISTDIIDNLKLIASGLSNERKEVKIKSDSFNSNNLMILNLVLFGKTTVLDEVVVNANKPIVAKNDTISIKVETFLDGTEEVVEDILKKLPGVEVTKDGTVMVQGKSVEKVLIEGDDLFEKGYKLLTKNLNAGIIDKVEILEHFSENILLKNIENSDKVAINLSLKEDSKKALFGTLSASYGTKNFYEEKANIISFNNKTKYYFFGNLNNIGSDAIGDIYQIIYPDVFTSASYIGDGVNGINLINLYANTPNLDESKYNFNNAELVSLNTIFNPNKSSKIKGLLLFTSDEKTYNSSSIEQFDLPPVSFVNNEEYQLRKNSFALSGKLDGLFNLNKKSQIEYVGRYSYGNFKENTSLQFNENSINESLRSKAEFTDHRITYTNRLNEYSALQVTSRYIYDYKPQDYTVDNFVFQEIFPLREDIEQISQKSFNKLNYSGLEGSFILNKQRSNLTLKLGYTSENNILKSQFTLIDSKGGNFDAGENFTNNLVYRIGDLYLNTKYIYWLPRFN